MNQVIQKEHPFCNACGMKKMTRDGALFCPNCDTSSPPSGLVSRTKDPGAAGFIKKVIKGTDGKDYEVMVAKDTDDQPDTEIFGDVPTVPQFVAQYDAGTSNKAAIDEVKERPGLLLKALRLVFEQHPARTLAEFKKLKKVRDQIDKLEFLIQNIKGE